jgi:hypothetical protein
MKRNQKQWIKENREMLNDIFGKELISYREDALEMECRTEEETKIRNYKIETYRFLKDVLGKMKVISEDSNEKVDKFI